MTIESWEASYLISKMLEKYGVDVVAPDVPIGDFAFSLVARATFTNMSIIYLSISIVYLVSDTCAAVLLLYSFSSGRSVTYAPAFNCYIYSSVTCESFVFILEVLYAEARDARTQQYIMFWRLWYYNKVYVVSPF